MQIPQNLRTVSGGKNHQQHFLTAYTHMTHQQDSYGPLSHVLHIHCIICSSRHLNNPPHSSYFKAVTITIITILKTVIVTGCCTSRFMLTLSIVCI